MKKPFFYCVLISLIFHIGFLSGWSCKTKSNQTEVQAVEAQAVNHLTLKTYEVWVISIYETNVEAMSWQQAREKAIKNWKRDTTSKKGHWDKDPAIQGSAAKSVIIEIKKKDRE